MIESEDLMEPAVGVGVELADGGGVLLQKPVLGPADLPPRALQRHPVRGLLARLPEPSS
jgi:hypothetical protein